MPSKSFFVERVNSIERALDVHVYRGWSSVTVEEYLSRREERMKDAEEEPMSRSQAVQELMKGYDEYGVNTQTCSNEPVVTFCAVYCGNLDTDAEFNDFFRRTNGVVGTVDCQVKMKDTSNNGECINGDSKEKEMPVPWPHLYRKNLSVDPRIRRKGVGLGLVRADRAYACERGMKAIVLDVDPSNESGAIQLNKREGFEFVQEGVMVCPLS